MFNPRPVPASFCPSFLVYGIESLSNSSCVSPLPLSCIIKDSSSINTLTNLVSKTLIGDGREDDLKKMYDEKRKTMFSGLSKMVGKVVENEDNDSNKIVE